ncbi:MAG: MBL fold metallo-hydrolase [bacterium]
MMIPLEDSWNDVIRKGRRGLGLSEQELAQASGLSLASIMALEQGILEQKHLEKVGTVLGLRTGSLLALSRGDYHPGNLELPEGMAMFTTPWNDFEVHSYLLWDQKTMQAVAFDTGSDASEMLEFLKAHELSLSQIFLTHGHGDHVFELDRLMEKTKAPAWIGEREAAAGAENFSAGREFLLGSLRIETRSTWGHAVGGITFVIHGLEGPAAIVGDALFAGSMGGPMISYEACLTTNREEIFSLPPDTLLCPGHGPLTTVALEMEHNPFFT